MSLSPAYIAWASDPDTTKVIAAQLTPLRVADQTPLELFWADLGGKWDGVYFYEPVITTGPTIEYSTQIITHGVSRPVFGALGLSLVSGSFLDPLNQVRADELVGGDYAFYGQPIVIYQGGPDLDWEDWAELLNGYMGHPSPSSLPFYGRDEMVFKVQIPPNVYVPPEEA